MCGKAGARAGQQRWAGCCRRTCTSVHRPLDAAGSSTQPLSDSSGAHRLGDLGPAPRLAGACTGEGGGGAQGWVQGAVTSMSERRREVAEPRRCCQAASEARSPPCPLPPAASALCVSQPEPGLLCSEKPSCRLSTRLAPGSGGSRRRRRRRRCRRHAMQPACLKRPARRQHSQIRPLHLGSRTGCSPPPRDCESLTAQSKGPYGTARLRPAAAPARPAPVGP